MAGDTDTPQSHEDEGLTILSSVRFHVKLFYTDDSAVTPLQISGGVDSDISKLTTNEMMLWALANLWNECKEGGYSVRHGKRPVRDFGYPKDACTLDPNHQNYFERAFPILFPYGVGGIEGEQEVAVEFNEHVRWAMQYHDRRFHRHETFAFLAFGIAQRRQALASARIQMRHQNFDKDVRMMATITMAKLEKARREEQQHQPISDPAVRRLRQHIHATVGRGFRRREHRS